MIIQTKGMFKDLMGSYVKNLECSSCSLEFPASKAVQLCSSCQNPLLVRYNLEEIKKNFNKEDLINRPSNLWRYYELLPVGKGHIISMGEGMTPLLHLNKVSQKYNLPNIYLKDEGLLPTGTFKARGAAVGVSKARELGVNTFIMPTNGNAGAAWSMYAARADINSVVVMPEDVPYITKYQCKMAGAKVYLVKGLINDAGKIVAKAVEKYGWYDASTLKEPYRIEGKKTMGLEIAEQLNWKLPDVIIYPTGGGVGLIGIYKALVELFEIGWIEGKMPKFVAVQAEGCAPIVKAFEEKKTISQLWKNSHTVAFGINVPKALGDFLVLRIINKTGGQAVSVSEDEILESQYEITTKEGIFICPEGGATFAALKKLKAQGLIKNNEKIVLINTGTGLIYPGPVKQSPPLEIYSEI